MAFPELPRTITLETQVSLRSYKLPRQLRETFFFHGV